MKNQTKNKMGHNGGEMKRPLFLLFLFLLSSLCLGATLNLTWTNTDTQSPAPTFRIERGLDCVVWTQIAETATGALSYADTGLSPATTYCYRVRAHNAAGDSGYSNTASETTLADPPPPPPIGLVAAFALDEGTGTTTADISGNGNTGTISGATWVVGKYGQALSFDGSDDYITAGSSALFDLPNGTITFWYFGQSNINDQAFVAKDVSGVNDGDFFLRVRQSDDATNPNKILVTTTQGGVQDDLVSTIPAPFGAWVFLGITFGSGGKQLFINGIPNSSNSNTNGMTNATADLIIGSQRPGASPLNGQIDNVRVYNRALSQSEIEADMNTPLGAVPTGMAANVSVTTTTQP